MYRIANYAEEFQYPGAFSKEIQFPREIIPRKQGSGDIDDGPLRAPKLSHNVLERSRKPNLYSESHYVFYNFKISPL